MSVQPTCTVRRHPDVAPRGFSITELLVVIGIIVLLIFLMAMNVLAVVLRRRFERRW